MYQFDQPLLTALVYNVTVHFDNLYHFHNDIEKKTSIKIYKIGFKPLNELINNRSFFCHSCLLLYHSVAFGLYCITGRWKTLLFVKMFVCFSSPYFKSVKTPLENKKCCTALLLHNITSELTYKTYWKWQIKGSRAQKIGLKSTYLKLWFR